MTIARLGGIRIRVNLFLLVLCALYVYLGLAKEIFIILSSVVLHEVAHIIIARGVNVTITEVELLPFGGQAKMEDFTGLDPDREIYVALAGPIMSLLLAALIYFLPGSAGLSDELRQLFISINFFLGIFNLLPALPLDGGRILRAILSRMMGYKKATACSAGLGKVIALTIMGYGGYLSAEEQNGQHFLVVGMILFWAAHREGKLLAYAFMRYLVHKKSELSKKGSLPSQQIVSREDTLVKTLVESTRPTYYMIIVVVNDHHQISGMRTEAELIEALFEKGPLIKLGDC